MKKLLGIIAIVLFLSSYTAPVSATVGENLITIKIPDDKPKKDKAEDKKKEECTKAEDETKKESCADAKKECCKKDKEKTKEQNSNPENK